MFLVLYPEVTAQILWKQLGMTGGSPKGFLHQSMGRKREALGRSLWCVSHPQMWQGHYILVMLLQTPFKMLLSDGKNQKYPVYIHFYMMEFDMIDHIFFWYCGIILICWGQFSWVIGILQFHRYGKQFGWFIFMTNK